MHWLQMHACETTILLQLLASKPHSAHPAGLLQIKQLSSGTCCFFSCFFFSAVAGVSRLICLIAFELFDQSAYSPCGISLPQAAHLPLYLTNSLIQSPFSLISFSPSPSLLLSTRLSTRRESCRRQISLGLFCYLSACSHTGAGFTVCSYLPCRPSCPPLKARLALHQGRFVLYAKRRCLRRARRSCPCAGPPAT